MKWNVLRLVSSLWVSLVGGLSAGVALAASEQALSGPAFEVCSSAAQADFNVLVVGNSFSANNDAPKVLQRLLLQTKCFGSVTLKPVIRLGGRLLSLKSEDLPPPTEAWDAVILQDNSRAYEWGVAEGLSSSQRVASRVTLRTGGQLVLVETWPTLPHPEAFPNIEKYFSELQLATGADVARVGTHFADPQEGVDRALLYAGDGKHPSQLGTALYVCVLANKLLEQRGLKGFGVSPESCAKLLTNKHKNIPVNSVPD